MAINTWTSRITLNDALKAVNNGKYEGFVNTLTETNDIMADIPYAPGNGISTHQGARIDALPTPEIIDIGDGWSSQTAHFSKYMAVMSVFKMRLDIPVDIMKIYPNRAQFRADLEDACGEGFGQGITNHVIYGDSRGAGATKKFDGLFRYRTTPSSTDPTAAKAGTDIFTFDCGGGTGSDTMSFIMIQPGYRKVFFVTPANDPNMGMDRQDMGMQEVITNQAAWVAGTEAKKSRYDVRTEFEQKLGLVIADERAFARLRNVPTTISSFTDMAIFDHILQAQTEVFKGPEPIFLYCNARGHFILTSLLTKKGNVQLDRNNPYGIDLLRIGTNVFVRRCDALLKTETGVAAA